MRFSRVMLALALAACSGKSATDRKSGGSAGGGGDSPGAAGEASSGGAAGSSGGTAGSTAGTAGSGTSGAGGGGEAELVACDHREVLCKALEPVCPEMQVASVVESCWGPCVKIELCACAAAQECPHEESYTCWSEQHCGPYVR